MENTLTLQEKISIIVERVNEQYFARKSKYLEMTKEQIYFNAYKIAHISEIEDIIFDMEGEDGEDCRFDEETIEKMFAFEGDIAERVFKVWINYNHPERFNFFAFEDLIDIIASAF